MYTAMVKEPFRKWDRVNTVCALLVDLGSVSDINAVFFQFSAIFLGKGHKPTPGNDIHLFRYFLSTMYTQVLMFPPHAFLFYSGVHASWIQRVGLF